MYCKKKGCNGKKTLKPLSGKTILEHHRLLRAMLHKAIYLQLIVSNPTERVQPPKTESSIREVAIPDFVISLLEEYKLWYEEQKSIYGELWTDSNRLFVQADGKPMHPSTISKWFVKYVAQIGLPVINFHGLRHTNATLLIPQNIDVAARLGHAQITTTFNFCVHPIISHNRQAGNVLENLLLPQKLV